jgi:glycosyltransferase involved in cell wall biosynthesis
MVHEPYLPFRRKQWRQNFAAAVHRVMTVILMSAAHYVWVSVPAWEKRLRAYSLRRQISVKWLPVINNVPIAHGAGASDTRARYACESDMLIGHFGTFTPKTAESIAPIVSAFRHDSCYRFLFIGKGSEQFVGHLQQLVPIANNRLHATGALTHCEISKSVAGCDLMMQPYQDGASSRRTSLMTAIAHGKPVVTTDGPQTEQIWKDSRAVLLAPVDDKETFVRLTERLAGDKALRATLGSAASKLYNDHFDIRHVLAAIRTTIPSAF